MTEKRFKSTIDEDTMSIMPYLVSDKEEECFYNLQGCVDLLNEQQSTIKQLESDKAIAEDYANIFEKENVKLRKKLNNCFVWMMEQNGRISGKDEEKVKELLKELEDE